MRSFFDDLLRQRYEFYGQVRNGEFRENKPISLAQGENSEDPKSLKLQKHGSTFLIVFCSLIITYYIAASVIAWYAYREWKGVAEDCAGGSVTLTTTGNVLNY